MSGTATLTPGEIDLLEPWYLGPTWTRGDGSPTTVGPWMLPEHTLGWRIAKWCTEYLLDIDDPEKPWRFTLEQLRFILWRCAVDERGKFAYRTGCSSASRARARTRSLPSCA